MVADQDILWVGGSSLRSADFFLYDIFSDLIETIREDGIVFAGEVQERAWKGEDAAIDI